MNELEDKIQYFILEFDSCLAGGLSPKDALAETTKCYAYVFHDIKGKEMDTKDLENRFTYHPPQPGQPAKYEQIREYAKKFAEVVNNLCPDSREKSLAITDIENAVSWANAAIARHE